jgi:hypothetical protein
VTLGDSSDTFVVTTGAKLDINGTELILDADADTSITADTDDQIDIKIAGADDFRFTANSLNVLSGSTLTVDSGATIANSGTATGFGGGKCLQVQSTANTVDSTASNAAGGQAGLYTLPSGWVWVNLATVTLTAGHVNNILVITGIAGGAASQMSNKGAMGLIVTITPAGGTETGYRYSNYPWYSAANTFVVSTYGWDQVFHRAMAAGSTDELTIDLKGGVYNEGSPSASHQYRFFGSNLSVLEIEV